MASNREVNLTRVESISGNDLIRVVTDRSRNITLSNLVNVLNDLLNSTQRVTTSTSNYLASNANDVILMDLTSGALSVTLPAASTATGKLITVKKIDGTSNDITVQTNGGNIDGSATVTMSGSGGAKTSAAFISDGSNWFILNA